MWRQQGRHNTGTTGGNSSHPTQQWMEPDDDEDVFGANSKHIRSLQQQGIEDVYI